MRTPRQWSDVFFDIAHAIAQRSKDPSTQCGAVVVSADYTILGMGFNGPPPQFVDELVPWEKRPEKYFYIEHAEENAIHYALSAHGSAPLKGSSLFVTHEPCVNCVRKLIRSNIRRIFYPEDAPAYKLTNPVTIEELIGAAPKVVTDIYRIPYNKGTRC
jgi:dCMP deaminase